MRELPAAATVASFAAARSNYTITKSSTGYLVRDKSSGASTLVGAGINLKFADVTVNTAIGDASNAVSPENLRTLTELYVAFFNRVPDADGLSYWISQFNAGQSVQQIAGAFYAAALQFSSTTGYTATMTNADFVKIVYKNVLGRTGTLAPPDTDVQYWANQLATGAASRGTLVNTMLSAAHGYAFDATWSWVSKLLDNKVSVANYFAVQQGLTYNTPEDSIAKTVAIAALVTQTSTAAAVNLVGVSDSSFNLTGGSCAQGVSTGFTGDIETTAANVGAFSNDTGGAGSGGAGGGGSAGGGGMGKVLGGLIRVTDLSNGVVVGEAISDTNTGLVTIRTCSRTGPFLVTMEGRAGAKYFDEGLNQLTDFGPGNSYNALVDKWDEHVGVSPLTEAAYRYALNNFKQDPVQIAAGKAALATSGSLTGLSSDQVRLANQVVLTAVNSRLTDKFQLASAKALPTPIVQTSSNVLSSSKYGVSAAVNGGIVQAASQYNPSLAAPALSVANALARDLTDGRINGFALDGSRVASADQTSYESVRLTVASMVGTNAVTLRFGATTLASALLTIDEESSVQLYGSQLAYSSNTTNSNLNVNCDGFLDDVALMSDASVTVVRRFPTNINGSCSYTFNSAENAKVVTYKRFLTDVKLLSKGGPVVFAVKNDGTVVGWGENYCGRLSPSLTNAIYPQAQVVQGLKDITALATTWSLTIARDRTGAVYSWGFSGSNLSGRKACGIGATGPTQPQFTQYQDTAIAKLSNLGNISDTYGGGVSYFALTADGQVYAWGDGAYGLLGNSDGSQFQGGLTATPIAAPTLIQGLSNVRQLAFTQQTAFALMADGTVKAWGNDELLLLGSGTQRQTLRPTTIAGLNNIALIVGSDSGDGVRMIKFDGTALVWGGYQSKIYVPTVVTPPERVRYVVSRGFGFSVFFASGKVGRQLTDAVDQTPQFR